MDFFERQEIARRNTKWLLAYFALAVSGIILSVYAGLRLFLYFQFAGVFSSDHFWNFRLLGVVALATFAVILVGSLYKILALGDGGRSVATMLQGRLIPSNTANLRERTLLNVVEEMAIASGTPVPAVYVLPDVSGINAFAAGYSTDNVVIGITEGSLNRLNRDELQGVIGHEFSHILNGDMRLNLRLMGIIFGILCLAILGRLLLQTRGRKNPLPAAGIVLFIIGYTGVFFARLIKSAVNRQREFLADASSVQFTRNPAGLANALKKAALAGSRINNPNAEDASHLFFANGLTDPTIAWLSTHPPLEERIRELEPDWDGKFVIPDKTTTLEKTTPPSSKPSLSPLLTTALGVGAALPIATVKRETENPVSTVGTVTPQHLDYASQLLASLPEPLRAATRDPDSAVTLIFALLLDPNAPSAIPTFLVLSQADRQQLHQWLPLLQTLDSRARMPLASLSLNALRQLSREQYARFSQTLELLITSDGKIDLFEFALQKMVQRQLSPLFSKTPKATVLYYSIESVLPDCALLLSALAQTGQSDPEAIAHAFNHGMAEFPFGGEKLILADWEKCGLEEIDTALTRLNQSSPQIKKIILNACAATVADDGLIQQNEAELLRAIGDALDCPIPPFLSI